MPDPQPAGPEPAGSQLIGSDVPAGQLVGSCHYFPLRIYFEDTDMGGIVYHANYLRYMERARSDLLMVLGIDQRAAHEAGIGVYAIADLSIRYLRPARLQDALVVETRCLSVGAASVEMAQTISRGAEQLTDARVRAGFVGPDGRPRRQPQPWIDIFRGLLPA